MTGHGFAVKGFFKTIRNQYLVNNMMKYVVNHSCSESLHRYLINGMLIRLIKRDMDGWLRWKTKTTVEIEEAVEERFGAIDITFCGWLSSN